jgi:hypothetical protein
VSEHGVEPAAGEVPPMPRPSPQSYGDLPLQTGSTSTLGIKRKSRDNAFYFLAAQGALRRYGRRFPLTEDGWVAAWTAFATEDPEGAALYRDSLNPSLARPAGASGAAVAATGSGADISEGWLYILSGGAGWVIADVVIYEGARHLSAAPMVIGGVVGFFSIVVTLIGVIAEGIRLARRT